MAMAGGQTPPPMRTPLTLRSALATCRDEGPLPEERRLDLGQNRGPAAVLAALRERFAAHDWPVAEECSNVREFFLALERLPERDERTPIGIACAADGMDVAEPFQSAEFGGGGVLVDWDPGAVQLRRVRCGDAKNIGDLLGEGLGGSVPDLTLVGLPVQSRARRDLVGAVPSALHSYLPWSGTHEAHVVCGLGIALAVLQGEIPMKRLRLPHAPKSIAVLASHGRSFLGLCLLERS